MGGGAENLDRIEGVTELRIHGVGGATPEALLNVPFTKLVAGGLDAGFFRPADWVSIDASPVELEAYSWGGITSRSRTRALWLFLLPFAFLNVAGWMFTPDPTDSGPGILARLHGRGITVASVRLAALLTTAIFVTMISILTIDIFGYRCAVQTDCTGYWFLGPWRWWTSDPTEAIGLGVAIAALIMLGIAAIASGGKPVNPHTSTDSTRDPARRVSIRDAELWNRSDVAHRLGLIHTTVTLCLVSLFGVEAASRVVELDRWLSTMRILALVVIAAAVLLLLFHGRLPVSVYWIVWAGSVISVVVTVQRIWSMPSPTKVPEGALMRDGIRAVFGIYATLFMLWWAQFIWRVTVRQVNDMRRPSRAEDDGGKAVANRAAVAPTPMMLRSDGRAARTLASLRGFASRQWEDNSPPLMPMQSVLPVLGAGIAVVVGAGLLLRFQSQLKTNLPTGALNYVAVFGMGWMLMVFVVGSWIWFSHPGRTPEEIASEDLGDVARDQIDLELDELWLRKISSAESAARVPDRAEAMITIPAGLTLLAIIVLTTTGLDEVIDRVAGPSSWALSLLPIGLMVAMNSLYRNRNFRRSLGIIWDLATLWPRWFHPWAPPSYGEKAIPHLQRRIRYLTEDGHGVVISAHSQGTVVAVAALAGLDTETKGRLAVVTHGSPLTRVYGRYFAEFFSDEICRNLAGELRSAKPSGAAGGDVHVRWRNFFRRTDYIGGPVFQPPGPRGARVEPTPPAQPGEAYEDQILRDPYDPSPLMRGDPRPRTLNHSDYYVDPRYRATVRELAERVRPSPEPA